ncbi:hamartin-like [Ptychodera flava]|uniref:hamartin-like n=1 Tax=Ptychodera flava TaxID=63121 RepID=UPI00396A0971
MASTTVDASELFNLLESQDLRVVEEIKTLIHENLSTAREPWLLNGLVDYYMASRSQRAMEILATVREPLDKHLFDKLNENIKGSGKHATLTLLGYTVRKQPSWLHKIVHTQLFNSLLDCIKSDVDIPAVMSSVLIITTLLPIIPSFVGPYLNHIFEGFSRLASWKLQPPGIVPDVYIIHLQVAVYSMFHRLYGMYPCNFLSYLRERYGKDNSKEFNQIILPMLEHVRMHPNLVTGSKDMETDTARWRKMESHDIVMECAKISLDTLESTRDDIPYNGSLVKSFKQSGSASQDGSIETEQRRKQIDNVPSTPKHPLPLSIPGEISTVWSPSVMCGLSTPPSQVSPTSSLADVSCSLFQSVPQTPTHLSSTGASGSFHFHSPENCDSMETSDGEAGRRLPRGRANILSRLTQSLVTKSATPSPPPCNEKCQSLPVTPCKDEAQLKLDRVQNAATSAEEGDKNIAEKVSERLQAESEREPESEHIVESNRNVSMKDLSKIIEGLSQSMEHDGEDFEDAVNEEISSIVNTPRHSHADDFERQRSRSVTPFKSTTETLTGPSSYPDGGFCYRHQNQCNREETINFCSDLDTPVEDSDFRMRASSDPVTSKVKGLKRKLYHNESLMSGRSSFDPPSGVDKTGDLENQLLDSTRDVCIGTDDIGLPNGKEVVTQVVTSQTTTITSTRNRFAPIREDSDGVQTDVQDANVETDAVAYMNLFPMVLPPSMLSECISQLEQSPHCSNLSFPSPGVSMNNSYLMGLSPAQLLDRHIELGGELHAEELSRVPLPSQSSADWTHFGGPPPADELNILKGQIQLLHYQLLYERHKREVHAQRNRRLLGKTHKAVAMEELATARLDEVRLLESTLKDVQAELRSLRDENVTLRVSKDDQDKHQQDFLRKYKEENEKLLYQNKELESKVLQQMQEVDRLTMDLKCSKDSLSNITHELQDLKEKVAVTYQYKEEVKTLKKEIVLMGEYLQTLQDRLMKAKDNTLCHSDEIEMIESAYKREVSSYKEKVQHLSIQLEASKVRINEMDAIISQKEMTATEQKRFLENVKSLSKGQLQAMEAKYTSLKKTNQRLEAHILKLYNELGQQKGGVSKYSALKNRSGSDSVPSSKQRDSPVGRESPMSTESTSASTTSSVTSSSRGSPSDSPTKRNVKFKGLSDLKSGSIEPMRPLFNINSPGITFSTSSPFKKFHEGDQGRQAKASTLPRTSDASLMKLSGQMAQSYPPPGTKINVNKQDMATSGEKVMADRSQNELSSENRDTQ